MNMSLPTAICATVAGVCAGALFWMRAERSERRLSTGAATLTLLGLLLLFGGINAAVVSNARLGVETRTELERVARQESLVDGIVAELRKAETGQRGFLLTHRELYLQSYQQGLEEVQRSLEALQSYRAGDRRRGELQRLTEEKLAELALTIRLQREQKGDEALAVVEGGKGFAIMAAIEAKTAQIDGDLKAEFARNLKENERSLQTLQRTVSISTLVAALLVIPGLLLLRMEIRRRTNLEAELRNSSRSLEEKVNERTAEIQKYSQQLREEVARRRETAQLLREAAERLRLALDFAKLAVWSWQPAEDRTVWSGAVKEVFGVEAEQMNGYATFREVILAEDRALVDERLQKSLAEGCDFNTEFRVALPNGESRWIAGYGGVLFDEHGQLAQMAGVNLDISERKRVEQKLEMSERHFRELAESMPQIVWTANANGEFEYHNDRWCTVTGLAKTGISAEDRRRIMHPDDYQGWAEAWRTAQRNGEPYDLEYRFFDVGKQEYRWFWGHAVPVRDAHGQVTRWFGTSIDIHERKVAELQLAESERVLRKRDEQLAMLFASGSIGDFFWDFAKGEVAVHPAIWALFGEPGECGTATVERFTRRFHPDDAKTMAGELQAALDGTKPLDVEYRVVWPDGTVRWLASKGVAIRDEEGRPIQMHGIGFDITERKLASLRVQESERHFREMSDAMPQIVWRAAPNGVMDYCNARWYEYTGYTEERTNALGSREVVHPDDLHPCVETERRGIASGEPFELEFRLRRASDGAYRWHLARWVPYRDLDGSILRWFGAATDIHEQKLAKERLEVEVKSRTEAMQLLEVKEEQLVRSLAEKNTLLQEVHHRVKNNLQVISSLLRMQGEVLKDQTAAAALKESHQRVLSMALIHEQLYGNKEMDQIDFAEFTQTLVSELFRSYAGTGDRVSHRTMVEEVRLQIDQAIPCGLILNELVTNALKYAYPNGKRGEVVIELRESDAGMVTLSVSDQGVGLPAEFDWSNSASMGLPIVDLLTQQLGGTLAVRTSPGASFTIEFPKDREKTKASAA